MLKNEQLSKHAEQNAELIEPCWTPITDEQQQPAFVSVLPGRVRETMPDFMRGKTEAAEAAKKRGRHERN